jgi:hypothetical protein
MTTIKIDRLSAAFGRMFESYRAAQKRGLLNAAIKGQSWIVTKILPSIEPYPPFDMGAFRAGWNFKATEDGAIIFNPVPHAPFINFGVPKPRVSGRHLVEWVIRKNIADSKNAPRVAWLIARKINARGLFTDPQFRITQRVVDEFLVKEVAAQIVAELQKVGWKP